MRKIVWVEPEGMNRQKFASMAQAKSSEHGACKKQIPVKSKKYQLPPSPPERVCQLPYGHPGQCCTPVEAWMEAPDGSRRPLAADFSWASEDSATPAETEE